VTPALLQRLRVATDTIAARYGRPIKAPVVVGVNANDSFSVQPSPPMIFEQGQVALILQQVTAGLNLHNLTDSASCEVHALAADALAWCTAVEAGTTAALHHNSSVILYEAGNISIGVGPAFQGSASGNPYYGVAVYGPVPITPAALASLVAAIRSMVQ